MQSPTRNLAQLLGNARRWFDEALLAALTEAGEEPVSAVQVGLFAVLDECGTTASELARRMGVTRQTVHQAVQGLMRMGLLEQVADPSSGRQRLLRRTSKGERAHVVATRVLGDLENTLAQRIGFEAVSELRAALEADWGDPPTTSE